MVFMISQPMANIPKEHILSVRQAIESRLRHKGHHVLNTYLSEEEKSIIKQKMPEDVQNKPLYYLATAMEIMSRCDAVYFCKGWASARGCRVEYQVACEYGLNLVVEDETETAAGPCSCSDK